LEVEEEVVLLWLMIGPVWDLAAAVDEIEIEVE
jgi:hypothetical protein